MRSLAGYPPVFYSDGWYQQGEMAMNWLRKLFSGAPAPQRALTKEEKLVQDCPQKFYGSNPWTEYAGKILFHGIGDEVWKWKTDDEKQREKQLSVVTAVMNSRGIRQTAIIAVVAWKLSEMLSEPPVYVM